MKFEVGHAARVGLVDRFRNFRQRALQALEIGDAGALAGQPNGLTFDGDARLHHVVHHVRPAGPARR